MFVAKRGVTRISVTGAGYWPAHGRWWVGLNQPSTRWITTSIMPKTTRAVFEEFRDSLLEIYTPSQLRFAIPDLGVSKSVGQVSPIERALRDGRLLDKEMELSVIVSAANDATLLMSDSEYRQALLQRIERLRATGAGKLSVLVVRGSQQSAYGTADWQRRVDERYRQACDILTQAGVELWLVVDLYGESKYVLSSLDFKLGLKPSCLVVQPIKHWAGVTRETRSGLAKRLEGGGGILQLVQLEETQALIERHKRRKESLQVGPDGVDLYVYDLELPGLVRSLGNERVEQLNVAVARSVLGPFLKKNTPNDEWWTRVGMGVGLGFAKRLAIVDRMAPVFETNLSDPGVSAQLVGYLSRSNLGFTDAELRQWLLDAQLRSNYDFKERSIA